MECSGFTTCVDCMKHPACGWCDDGSDTGLGTCMEGSLKGPIEEAPDGVVIAPDKCPDPRWSFAQCPCMLVH